MSSPRSTHPRLLLALAALALAPLGGCRVEPAAVSPATAGATIQAPPPVATDASPVTIAAPPTATGRPTQTSAATAARPTRTPPPTPTSAPHQDVIQLPYAASDCSDKYPCNDDRAGWEARIQVPAGFAASYFARVDGQPTSLAFGPDGLLYVATQAGEILTVDAAGRVAAFMDGFNTPTGLAFRPGTGDLYVSDRVLNLNEGGEAQISVIRGGRVRRLFGGIPCCYTYFHAANGIAFGPDGYGYVGVGATADHGEILPGNPREGELDEPVPWEATILRFSPDGREVEPYAFGLRNAYDIAWDASGRLYATDNAPDFGPPDELHRVEPGGQHGYPWYDCDVCFAAPAGVEAVPPLYEFVPHAAAAGLTVYQDDHFPGYFNNLFVALWSAFEGAQRIVRLGPDGQGASDFATGFAAPIDVTVGPDGRLYIADWATGILFQIAYEGRLAEAGIMGQMSDLAERYDAVQARIAAAAERAGRPPETITLVAVTKTWPAEVVAAAYRAGLRHFGENRAEELAEKRPQVERLLGPRSDLVWHAIGALQSRKTDLVADAADVFHALDRRKIARRLSARLVEAGRADRAPLPIYIEVNVSGEASKVGVNCSRWEDDSAQRDELLRLAQEVATLPGLMPQGLMTMAPWQAEPAAIRRLFGRTRELAAWLQAAAPDHQWSSLSIGMTDDFELAIEEGATHIRVGRALFGERA